MTYELRVIVTTCIRPAYAETRQRNGMGTVGGNEVPSLTEELLVWPVTPDR